MADLEVADKTIAARVAEEKITELQACKDEHDFMVQQADVMAEPERKIAAAKGDEALARQQSMAVGWGSRGTVRKRYENEEDTPSPPQKGSKQPRVESVADDEELFGRN